jgi:hypothetical protein
MLHNKKACSHALKDGEKEQPKEEKHNGNNIKTSLNPKISSGDGGDIIASMVLL